MMCTKSRRTQLSDAGTSASTAAAVTPAADMHDHGCDDTFIIVMDMKRAEMDAATEYFKFVCQHTFGQTVKHNTVGDTLST